MRFYMDAGDTNLIGMDNVEQYKSFVDEDWELDILLKHFNDEMKNGHILVCQMTEEGIEHSWNVEVKIGTNTVEHKCFRRTEGYIKVTDNQLYLVDYDCLTMAAQFESDKVPDKNCSRYKIDIENGIYKVTIVQYYNVDKDEYVGTSDKDMLLHFTKVAEFQQSINHVLWGNYH